VFLRDRTTVFGKVITENSIVPLVIIAATGGPRTKRSSVAEIMCACGEPTNGYQRL
jgi:hypothetical protein